MESIFSLAINDYHTVKFNRNIIALNYKSAN